MSSPTRLSLLPFLQAWDGGALAVRLVIIPRGDPTEPLVSGAPTGSPSFANANLVIEARIVPGLNSMPTLSSASVNTNAVIATPADRGELFQWLAATFPIDPAPPAPVRPSATTRLRKYLPHTFRDAAGWTPGRTRNVVTDDSYFCLLDAPPKRDKLFKKQPSLIPWGKVIAIALRQPALAEALGITRPFDLPISPATLLEEGGWLYCKLASTSDASSLVTIPDALKLYAARIPPLGPLSRSLFSPVLFPVAVTPPAASYDELFLETMLYEDGFAKVVHATQPRAAKQVSEEADDTGPVNDVGVRLGWDDEQITIWQSRQMENAGLNLDAPLGVLGFHVDVRETDADPWSSLSRASGKVRIGGLDVTDFTGEHAFEVHPIQHDAEPTGVFWLSMYFANWHGPSLIGLDDLQAELTGRPMPPADDRVKGEPPAVELRYGRSYQFRVRLVDHSGGGPAEGAKPVVPAPAPIGRIDFRRFVRPQFLTPINRPPATPDPTAPPAAITLRRPLLGYPTVVFTDVAGAEALLRADLPAAKLAGREVGLPDPDVAAAEIEVQVRMPGFDPAGGEDGYRTVYSTVRPFPAAGDVVVPLAWQDIAQVDTLTSPAVTDPLPLPTGRDVRLRYRAVGRNKTEYWGTDEARFGPSRFVRMRSDSTDETALLREDGPLHRLRAMFLRPERPADRVSAVRAIAEGQPRENAGAALERVAELLDLDVEGMTLRGRPGRRTVFGATHAMRHVLGPDAATLSFASKSDLFGQWLVAVRATLARDWSWDGLDDRGIQVMRRFGVGAPTAVGHLVVPPTINPDAIKGGNPDRSEVDLVFIDAVDPKEFTSPHPREIDVSYHLEPSFRGAAAVTDPDPPIDIRLPITTPPTQRPKLVSAGVALEPYVRFDDYSRTEPRQRHLWLEFDRPLDNPRDGMFCRILGYGPDPELIPPATDIPEAEEPSLPIDPEPIRAIAPSQPADAAGLSAMTRLVPSTTTDPGQPPVFYLMPLPPGVASVDDELLGFFTYELRVGHADGWSTAQGRFGTPLRVTGVQHPAPPLSLDLRRSPAGIVASASFANPVLNGQSLQPMPPRSEIWILLYVQVVQADGQDRRNVLLGRNRALVERPHFGRFGRPAGWDSAGAPAHSATAAGSVFFSDDEIRSRLRELRLPHNASLSCLGVELLPNGDPLPDPLGADLGHQRIMRTSPLVAVPEIC